MSDWCVVVELSSSHNLESHMQFYVWPISPAEWELLPRLNAAQRAMSVQFLIDEFVAAQVMFGAVTDESYEHYEHNAENDAEL